MKLDMNPFPVSMVELEHKKILVCTDQAKMIKGKNVIISNDFHNQMIILITWRLACGRRISKESQLRG
jgi:hypothetical protein